ncbi:17577_t:CDS:2 [Acaulospora colombiana]|uniref:17577_t:CDS:1 n=1 Tax=Acaulospora colombiana TaxID=27376 RepID=A0ACA9ME04_9GLOM|nr:17577_t:CDS:2 [Acaulospora colombiana]
MGGNISSILESAAKKGGETDKEAQDALNIFFTVAEGQGDNASRSSGGLLPINKIMTKDNLIYCQTTDNPVDIIDIINQKFSQFASGDVAKGIAAAIQASISRLLGGSSGASFQTSDSWFVYLPYTFKELYSPSKYSGSPPQGACLIVSKPDLSDVDDKKLRILVQYSYGNSSAEQQAAIYTQLLNALQNNKHS